MGTLGVLMIWMIGVLACVSADKDFFFVVAPNMIRFEHPETVMISVFGRPRTVRTWLSHNDHTFSTATTTVNESYPAILDLKVTEADLVLNEFERKPGTIRLFAECDGEQLREDILIKYSSGYIYVQTSQPIYKPGDRVKIRYLALTESMQTVGDRGVNVSMDVITPKGHVFVRNHKTERDKAFHKKEFELHSHPDLIGIWTVKVYFRGMYKTEARTFFEVREYVVPTFGVDISADTSTILPYSESTISVTVTSKYVYGKPVTGRCNLKLWLAGSDDQTELMEQSMSKLDAEGMTNFKISMTSMKRILEEKAKWFPNGQSLKIIANCSEDATLNRESGIHTGIMFSEKPYVFKFIRSQRYFRKQRNYYLRIDVQRPNGEAAKRVRVKAWKVGKDEEQNGPTNEKGKIRFMFTNSSSERMTFKADVEAGNSMSDEFIVEAYKGSNQITAEHHILQPDNVHQITARADMKNPSTGLTSMIIARGTIIDAGYDVREKEKELVKILNYNLQEKLSPSGRYVVFYVDTTSNEVVAESIKVSMTPSCKGHDIILSTEDKVSPGDSAELTVKGQKGTHVGLSVLDKATLLRNGTNVLQRNKNAGLTVITNAHMDTEGTRKSVSCEDRRHRRRRAVECQVDQRCCDKGESFASSLYEIEDVKKGRKVVDVVDCYSKVRQLLLDHPKMPWMCLVAYYHSCAEYVQYENKEDWLMTKSGSDEYKRDLQDINFKEDDIRVRQKFMESFGFKESTINDNTGKRTFNLKYPDSITEWMIQAIGFTPNNGVCISEPLNVTAFREFFIQLDLPYQAVRMEHVNVKATVFAYGKSGEDSSPVSLYMSGVTDLCSNVRPGRKSKKVEFKMQPNSAHTVQYPIIPMYAKRYPIEVIAVMNKKGYGRGDAIRKYLNVKSEGAEQLLELSTCLDPMKELKECYHTDKISVTYSKGETQKQIIDVDLTLPEHITGTGQGTAYIYGDNAMEDVVQTVLIKGVENWIQQPTGCTEQTLIKLAPLVYAMKYLKLTKQVTDKIEQEGNNYIRSGVLKEFSWKKETHYYPPFRWDDYYGRSHANASTWLTAYVVKVFCQAREVVDDAVEESVHIEPTLDWLATNQNDNGSFTEYNEVNNRNLMSLSKNGSPALTAFILIAMQECGIRSKKVTNAINKSMKFLEQQLNDINTLREEPYVLAIMAYALAISGSKEKMKTYERLKNIAGGSEDIMYWGWSGTGTVQPSHIEATSYALLAQLQLDDLKSSSATVTWLSQHRSSGGAFKTTQDTVIGLQALSEYNIRTYRTDIDLRVTPMYDNIPEIKKYSVNNYNALEQKTVKDLPVETGSNLRVEVTGKGTGKMRIDLRYNVEMTDVQKCPFDINVTSKLIKHNKTAIELGKLRGCECGVCNETIGKQEEDTMNRVLGTTEQPTVENNFGRRKRNAQESSREPKQHCTTVEVISRINTIGMVTIEVGLETGMTVLKEDLTMLEKNKVISMYELPTDGNGFFVLYIDEMLKNEKYRFSFTLKDTKIGEDMYNRQPSFVKVTDYYNPDSSCRATYGTGSNRVDGYGPQCNDGACKCVRNTCPEPWKQFLKSKYDAKRRNRKREGPVDFLIRRSCNSHYAEYAVLVKILGRVNGSYVNEQKHSNVSAEVVRVFNQGQERQKKGMPMNIFWRKDCQWPKFEKDEKYYVIARDGETYTDEMKEKKYKYYIREGDIVLKWKKPTTPVGTFMIKGYEKWWKTHTCQL